MKVEPIRQAIISLLIAGGCSMKKDALKPNDFPIQTEDEKLKNQAGQTVGSAASKEVAEDVTDRLNEHAHKEEEDRWSA
jgi:hypothetical protein